MTDLSRQISTFALRRRTDDEVFLRALRGDPRAFSEVYRRFHSRIYGYCLARTLSPEAAHDATQEAFVRFLSADPNRVEQPVGWLFRVARNVCIDILRRQQTSAAVNNLDAVEEALAIGGGGTAETEAMGRAEADAVFLALRRVRPRYRSALVLREIHQQPLEDVAESLGVKLTTAYTILSRARDAFGRAYAEVLDLPAPCRMAVEHIYRATGTGLNHREATALEAHVAECARCRREQDLSRNQERLPALLPLLVLRAPRGLLTRATQLLADSIPALSSAGHVAGAANPALSGALGLAGAALVIALSGAAAMSGLTSVDPGLEATAHPALHQVVPMANLPRGVPEAGGGGVAGGSGAAVESRVRLTQERNRYRSRQTTSDSGTSARAGGQNDAGGGAARGSGGERQRDTLSSSGPEDVSKTRSLSGAGPASQSELHASSSAGTKTKPETPATESKPVPASADATVVDGPQTGDAGQGLGKTSGP